MVEKRLIIIFLLLAFVVLVFLLDRKRLVYLIAAVLPMSFTTRYGAANIYLILGIAGADYLKSLGRREEGDVLPLAAVACLGLIFFAYFASFAANYWELDFPKGFFRSNHTISMLTIASCIALFTLVAKSIDTLQDARTLLLIAAGAYFVSSGASVLQLIDPDQLYIYEYFTHYQGIAVQELRGGVRVYGTLGEYELYAEYCAIMVVIILYLASGPGKSALSRVPYVLLVALTFYFLAMTKTRGALIALTIALGYIVLLQIRVIGIARSVIFLSVIVALYGSTYLFLKHAGSYNVIDHIATGTRVDVRAGQFDTRTKAWSRAVKLYSEAPQQEQIWGKGPGLGSSTRQMERYPHSLYLYVLLSLGAVGLFLYLLWFAYLYVGRSPGTVEQRRFALFMKAALLLFLIDQFKIEFLRVPAYQHIVWLLLGLLYVANKRGFSSEPQSRVA